MFSVLFTLDLLYLLVNPNTNCKLMCFRSGSLIASFGATFLEELDAVTISQVTHSLQASIEAVNKKLTVSEQQYRMRGWVEIIYKEPVTGMEKKCKYHHYHKYQYPK